MVKKEKLQIIDDPELVARSQNEKKMSLPILTKYEFDQVVSLRTMQLSKGVMPLIHIEDLSAFRVKSNIELRKIAEQELVEGRLPFIVRRPMPSGLVEYWNVSDLDLVAVRHLFRHIKIDQ